ncbi:MAG: hypothetical protein LBF62_10745 [Tannerellaceae bacterium]|jgi:hypothetical protein|nr:hypothetical protein [Tannerellaceae bacterium]
MKVLYKIGIALLFILAPALIIRAQKLKEMKDLHISGIELGYPYPEIPYYHFKATVELPQPSIMEVEVAVDGKVLRAVDLRRGNEMRGRNHPPQSERSSSGYGLSQDGTSYKDFTVTGWVKWQPRQEYDIRIAVRMKKNVQATPEDVIISGSRKVKAPGGGATFDTNWKSYKSVVLSETAGIDRKNEPVEVLLAFYPDEAESIARDIRVVSVDTDTHEIKEVMSQVYDIQEYLKEDDMGPDKDGNPTRNIPLWFPTVSARVSFLADVPAKTSRVFLVYYNNAKALVEPYYSDLTVQGDAPGLQVSNNIYSISLHNGSGHLDQIALKSKPDLPLFHRMETNGAIHWNPDIYVPPSAWTHSADWKMPKGMKIVTGPVVAKTEFWDNLRGVPEADVSVRYEFYPDMPYFISSTCMRINETVQALALRNAEMVFKRELITHAAWYDVLRDTIIVYDVNSVPDLTDLKMEADVPWIVLFNRENGIAFAGIQLGYDNSGIESAPRTLNPYFYVTTGPWVYWARALAHPFLSANMQQVVPVLKGNIFSEKWAFMIYHIDDKSDPFAPVLSWKKRLTQPLRIHLAEEVDDRVSKSLQEVFMDNGKSGWEDRQTKKK